MAGPAGPTRPAGALTPPQLILLEAVQDRLIPPEGDLPGAGEAGGARRVERLLAERPEWLPALLDALQAIDSVARRAPPATAVPPDPPAGGFLDLTADERDAVLRAVETAHARPFRWLLRLTYTAYYTDDAVQRAHGYATPPLPRGYPRAAFDASRLDPVRRRGKLWRDA